MKYNCNFDFTFSLSYKFASSFIEMKICGLMVGKSFKDNTLKMFSFLKDKGLHKVLIDASEMEVIYREDRCWLEKEFLPLATSQGFRAVSFIKPQNPYARMSIENVMYQIPEEKLKGAWFDTRIEAEGWLDKVKL